MIDGASQADIACLVLQGRGFGCSVACCVCVCVCEGFEDGDDGGGGRGQGLETLSDREKEVVKATISGVLTREACSAKERVELGHALVVTV